MRGVKVSHAPAGAVMLIGYLLQTGIVTDKGSSSHTHVGCFDLPQCILCQAAGLVLQCSINTASR